MKKILICLLGLMLLTGCGNKYAGTYKLEYYKYVGDSDNERSTEVAEIVLNADGTGISKRDGKSIDIKWSLEEEEISITENSTVYSGTLKDGKLVIYNGDKSDILTIEKTYVKE